MARYSKQLKDSIISKMMTPQNKTVSEIATETGIPKVTLYKWRKKAREGGYAVPSGQTKSERWSTQDKFHVELETATLSEVELVKYCREKGLFVEQVKAWKDACLQANGGVAEESARLQKNLSKKNKNIANCKKNSTLKKRA